jgi:hypothetical protein
MGTMVDDVDQKRMIKGHGTKGRWHEAKLETFEHPTIVIYDGWQNLPHSWSYMSYL